MIKEKAYAKINLFLNVIDKRTDGFHDLEMVMAPINLFDTLSFKSLPTKEIKISSNVKITDKVKYNLVFKVAKSMQEEFEVETGVEIHIKKRIPIAAGLAGGSADAAATLRGLNKLWNLHLSLEDLARTGLNFGSDIPYCVYNKLCIAKGRGEELVFIDKKLNLPLLLVNPNIEVSTKDVFNKVVKEDLNTRKSTDMTNAICNKNVDDISRELYNYLEHITFDISPLIKDIKDEIREQNIEGVLMSGSGATVYAISKDKRKLKKAYEHFSDDYYKKLTKIK